jgi:endonuclease III related protein
MAVQWLILDLPARRGYLPKEMSTSRIAHKSHRGGGDRRNDTKPRGRSLAPILAPLPILQEYYQALYKTHGPQKWWPGQTPFEVIVGAILTQNTAWANVERAITNLREADLLSPEAIENVRTSKLARLIRSSGYFRQKARKLKEFVRFLQMNYEGSLIKMFGTPVGTLREQLLGVHGVGPETADSILLYAGDQAVFVVDAYTRRILQRHGLAHGDESYEAIRGLFEKSLPRRASLINEFHALIVHTGKHFCRARNPQCEGCALRPFLPAESGAVQ